MAQQEPNPRKENWQLERDVAGELADATPPAGADCENLPAGIVGNPSYGAYADAHWCELVERYRPSILWNDAGYPAGHGT